MRAKHIKSSRHKRRKAGIRKAVQGTPQRPRLTVYRSLQHMYAQIIDDLAGRTLVCASSRTSSSSSGGNVQAAGEVGTQLAQKAKEAGITKVVFDRNGFKYHGRVQAVAEAARKAGLGF